MHNMTRGRALCWLRLVSGALAFALPVYASEPLEGARMPMAGDFSSSVARREISGAACGGETGRHDWCIAVNDERRWAQFFSIADGRIVPRERILLLPGSDGEIRYDEIDAEGAAYDNGNFYVVGSHGLSRSSAKFRASQFFIFRFPANKQTGRPGFPLTHTDVSPRIERSARLRAMIAAAPAVGPFAEKPLSENGLNIEGLVVRGGQIYVGFRGPSIAGKAFVMEVSSNAVFGAAKAFPKVHALALGNETGIRAMTQVSDGILLLAGPVNDQDVPWAVHHWSPASGKLARLAVLRRNHKGLAEALLVLSEKAEGGVTRYRVLVMYDGLRNGRPSVFEFQKR